MRSPTAAIPSNVSKARALIERDLDQMRTQDVSAGELHQAKALLLREIVLNESSEEAVARGLLARAELGLPLDEPQIASRKLYALTARRSGRRSSAPSGRTAGFRWSVDPRPTEISSAFCLENISRITCS